MGILRTALRARRRRHRHRARVALDVGCVRRQRQPRLGRRRRRHRGLQGAGEALGGEDRQYGHLRPDALLDHRPVRPVQAVARGRERRHRRLSRRRHLGAAALRAVPRPDRGRSRASPASISPRSSKARRVEGKLVAAPFFTDAPALYYRKDLLEKHGATVPETWEELTATAQKIQDAERAEGKNDLWGYVWQGAAYEGLTCNALEWIKSHGGGQIIEAGRHHLGQQRERGEGARAGDGLGQHHLAGRRPQLHRGGEPRRLADGQRRLHAQLALCLCARQRRRQPDQGPLRRGAAALGRRGQRLGGDARRLEPRGLEVLAEPRARDRPRALHGLVRGPEAGGAEAQPPADDPGALRRRRRSPRRSR